MGSPLNLNCIMLKDNCWVSGGVVCLAMGDMDGGMDCEYVVIVCSCRYRCAYVLSFVLWVVGKELLWFVGLHLSLVHFLMWHQLHHFTEVVLLLMLLVTFSVIQYLLSCCPIVHYTRKPEHLFIWHQLPYPLHLTDVVLLIVIPHFAELTILCR